MTKPGTWIGVDPGVNGAIAVLERVGSTGIAILPSVIDLPYHEAYGRKYLNVAAAILDMDEWPPETVRSVLIERAPAYTPNKNTVAQLAHAWGAMEALFRMYRFRSIDSKEWKEFYGITGGKKGKQQSLAIARERWGDQVDLSLERHDGRADALLIAAYGMEGDHE